ncbi:MAG: hypothetical protein ABH879_00210 [archaeon]
MKRLARQAAGGIVGAAILGVLLGYTLMVYGANHGCFSFVDALMQDKGYLSCGPFGLVAGAAAGAVLGIILVSLKWNKITR